MMSALEGPSNDRASAEARTAARRARVDGALERARTAVSELEWLRSDEGGGGPFVAAREHTAMMTLVHALATTHQELLSRYQQLQMAVAISRSLETMEQEVLKPAGVPREHLDEMLPSLSYRSVLRGSLAYNDLPGGGECAVCQSTLEPADVVRFLPCRHCFHTVCIDPWFERSVHCPSCRASVCSSALACRNRSSALWRTTL